MASGQSEWGDDMSFLLSTALNWTERGLIPDALIRFGIRRLCAARIREEEAAGTSSGDLAERMRAGSIAPLPWKANEQHYEVPPEFFAIALGRRRKYSCCLFDEGISDLDAAEEAALEETCGSAEIEDGMDILELGCGWGSLSLWMAEEYPSAKITAVSNSASQRGFIESEACRRGFNNLRVVTADMNDFSIAKQFDRVISVEMFEHMRNYDLLLERIAGWLKPGGKLFVHIFCHRKYAYAFETEGPGNWLGRHFFSGGIMPSEDLLSRFQGHMRTTWQKRWSGRHYKNTANAWLRNLDADRSRALATLENAHGPGEAQKWMMRWRVFFMACAELWGFSGGEEWFVSHYLLEPVREREETSRLETVGWVGEKG